MDYITELLALDARVEAAERELKAATSARRAMGREACLAKNVNYDGRRVRSPEGNVFQMRLKLAEAGVSQHDGQPDRMYTHMSYEGILVKKDGTVSARAPQYLSMFSMRDELKPGWAFLEE